MPRSNGSLIGIDANPNANVASGIWSVREAERLLRGGKWPSTPTVPGAPTPVAGEGEVSLTWAAPTGGSTPTDYVVQYSSNGGSTWTTFADGTSTATSATVTGLTNGTEYIFRIQAVNAFGEGPFGSASAGVTPVNNVVLLLHMDGSNGSTTFTDSSPSNKTVTAYGDAQISTAESKFGGASLYLDGDGDYLELADSDDFDFGTGDWTIEFWQYATDNTNSHPTAITTEGGWYTGSFAIRWDNIGGSDKFGVFFNPDDPLFFSTNTFPNDTWHHVAVVRESNTIRMYIDGVEEGSAVVAPERTVDLCVGGTLRIGWSAWDGGAGYLNDYLDELRISKGVARYTANFTPPTVPFV
jgi:hypothetical protein